MCIAITVNMKNETVNFEIPVNEISNIDKANKLMVEAVRLKELARLLEDKAKQVVIDNGGSNDFSYVNASERKSIDYVKVLDTLNIKVPEDVIKQCTKVTSVAPTVKYKGNKSNLVK